MKTLNIVAITAFAFLGLANFASAQPLQIQVTSNTFNNNDFLKIEAIGNSTIETSPGVFGNECAPGPKFPDGGNQSPPLSWTNPSPLVQSFVLIAFDNTAQVYHWGMYNISKTRTSLPVNAGVADSQFGLQTRNYSKVLGYIGPCPPANEPPLVHDYVFTVYGLRGFISPDQLPPNSDTEALQRAVTGRVFAQGSITGRWSSTCGQNPLYQCSQ
jgi:Raf kinase inhibitor-like YbhB/YbcL family protein